MTVKTQTQLAAYNEVVKVAYFKILEATQKLISSVDDEELRYTLHRVDETTIAFGSKVHEFISPIIHLTLECNDGEQLSIHHTCRSIDEDYECPHLFARILRVVYRVTSAENTIIDIENCLELDCKTPVSMLLFKAILRDNDIYVFQTLPYKASI
jgi:hypothetical protein